MTTAPQPPAPAGPAEPPRLPRHLARYVVDQGWGRYTPQDHAVWRYIMRRNVAFLKDHAHEAYVDGLRRTGISLERIPRIEEMNDILRALGWSAVTVDGFIPPAAFMEFQAHRVLVIAADMRSIDHIGYTPAPDIVHEAAGHAPIIADERYAEYLRRIGAVGARAFSSRADHELYEAIRHLSILKETPGADPAAVAAAERAVEERQAALGTPSEMARLSRLHWWTVEYGLVGTLEAPRIYGAGLLSSIGESARCLTPAVKKLPYGPEAAEVPFDITTMQPHLFVTPGFDHLIEVLDRFADTMAQRAGGAAGLTLAVESRRPATAVLDSGLQVSGVFAGTVPGSAGQPALLRTEGPSALACDDTELPGHGVDAHAGGLLVPLGRPHGAGAPLATMNDGDLAALGLAGGRRAVLRYDGGVTVEGTVRSLERHHGRLLVVELADAAVSRGDGTALRPGPAPLALGVGERVVSVFAGAADKDRFEEIAPVSAERTARRSPDEASRALHGLYAEVRAIRESRRHHQGLAAIWRHAQANHPVDWLLSLEVLEILRSRGGADALADEIAATLEARAAADGACGPLITDGLALLA